MIILYVNYEQYEYINYYHLIYNNEILYEYCPEEKLDDLFKKLDSIKDEVNNSEIYIVQDTDVSEWDYFKTFEKYNFILHPSENKEIVKLCDRMNYVLGNNFKVNTVGEIEGLNILFYSIVTFENDICMTEKMLKPMKEISEHDGEKMTGLAQIIKEKYERIKKND